MTLNDRIFYFFHKIYYKQVKSTGVRLSGKIAWQITQFMNKIR